jgi:hypothetical protein
LYGPFSQLIATLNNKDFKMIRGCNPSRPEVGRWKA